MSHLTAIIDLSNKGHKMEKTAYEIMREAMEILKEKEPKHAYAVMAGYALAGVTDVEMANRILKLVKENH
jgi:hypothetical protein